ncbi:nodulin-26-like [Pyrus ussuriensis x Pyrus communis]|uniref:Nodulin-26-like n=1 Tax=Pyrus ussuriensis x Pyrus communis TaxID=2448454 RepID=A0A5N5HQK4_9ROSA|nr:nodulin-26-like [Pyrus ussuriensis x Pyrus communis]
MSNSFSLSSPKLVLSIGHTTMQEAGANDGTQKLIPKADISTSIFQKMMAELVGTYILIFIGCGAALVNKIQPLTIVGIAIVWGLVFMAAAYAVGHVSGAHFNPAVTIALAAGRIFPVKHVPIYVMSQLSGATLASLTLRLLFNDQDSIQVTMTQFSDPTTYLQALTWEFVITFILMFTICGVVTDDRAGKNLSGIAIGGAFVVNVMIAGPITGASMNPARSLGPAIVTGVYKNIWVYIAAPILGAIAATMVYSVLRVPKLVKSDEKADPVRSQV